MISKRLPYLPKQQVKAAAFLQMANYSMSYVLLTTPPTLEGSSGKR